jgi:hypothetical protein
LQYWSIFRINMSAAQVPETGGDSEKMAAALSMMTLVQRPKIHPATSQLAPTETISSSAFAYTTPALLEIQPASSQTHSSSACAARTPQGLPVSYKPATYEIDRADDTASASIPGHLAFYKSRAFRVKKKAGNVMGPGHAPVSADTTPTGEAKDATPAGRKKSLV